MHKKALTAALLTFATTFAMADDYGCKVILCLGDPQGPMTQNDCKPPIKRFFEEQSRKNPPGFPKCEEANGTATGKIGFSPYDPCPNGTSVLPAGAEAILGRPKSTSTSNGDGSNQVVYTGNGASGPIAVGEQICVGQPLGQFTLTQVEGVGDGQSVNTRTVTAYDQVVSMPPVTGSGRYVDVFINGTVFKRVRF